MSKPVDAFIEAKKREVEAATEELMKSMSWPMIWLNPPYSDKKFHKIQALNYGFASDLFATSEKKMENKNKTYYVVVNMKYANLCAPSWTDDFAHAGERRFATELEALARAEECAKDNPGTEFTVARVVSRSVVETPAITTRLS